MPYASINEIDPLASKAAPLAIDWRAVAEFRLNRLVEAEHDVSLMRERIERLLAEHGEWLAAGEARFESRWVAREQVLVRLHQAEFESRWAAREQALVPLHQAELASLRVAIEEALRRHAESARQLEEILASSSWRITAPLRAATIALRRRRPIIRRLLLILLRVPGLQSLARQLLRPFPKLRSRVVTIIVTDV